MFYRAVSKSSLTTKVKGDESIVVCMVSFVIYVWVVYSSPSQQTKEKVSAEKGLVSKIINNIFRDSI